MMAMCDANNRIKYVDVGRNGRISDGGVFNQSSLARALNKGTLLPPPQLLPGGNNPDDAFAAKPYILKPISNKNLSGLERVFNYRGSRGRRTIENAFGILAARFRVFRTPINVDAVKTCDIAATCCVLHNYMMA